MIEPRGERMIGPRGERRPIRLGCYHLLISTGFAQWLVLTGAMAAIQPAANSQSAPRVVRTMADQLEDVRGQVLELEANLLSTLKTQSQLSSSIKKIRTLIQLQKQEASLAKARVRELEHTVQELEARKVELNDGLGRERLKVRKLFHAIHSAEGRVLTDWSWLRNQETEAFEAPRRKMMAAMADLGLKSIEAIKVDLADSGRLEVQIQQERAQLAALINEIKEQESILELNRQLHADVLAHKHKERVAQLASYRSLKKSEIQIDGLLSEFSSRRELAKLESATAKTKSDSSDLSQLSQQGRGAFAVARGRLELPLFGGTVIGEFGKVYDPKLGLTLFKKGIEIKPRPGGGSQPVKAIFGGKVAFVGVLPEYGQVAIVDHGDEFYSLSARLGDVAVKKGDWIPQGSLLGRTDSVGSPIYFEIRARNIAVNPLQWFLESSTFKSNSRSSSP